jgi:hypothetical protein
MLIDSGVGEEKIEQPRTFSQLEGVLAFVGQQGADVDGKILWVNVKKCFSPCLLLL